MTISLTKGHEIQEERLWANLSGLREKEKRKNQDERRKHSRKQKHEFQENCHSVTSRQAKAKMA